MQDVGTISAVLLAAVFALAGGGKLRRRRSTARAFADLGLPAPASLAVAVPAAELILAALLLARPRAGGAVALLALAAFSAVVARATRAGTGARCGCFGSASARPVSFGDLVRNALLAVAALAALAAPKAVGPTLEATVLVTAGAVAGLLVLALFRLHDEVGAVWDNRLAGEAAG